MDYTRVYNMKSELEWRTGKIQLAFYFSDALVTLKLGQGHEN